MPGTTLRIIIAIILFFHGVGHAMGIIPALQLRFFEAKPGSWLENWSSQSWLLTPLLGDTAARIIGVVLFLVALVGFAGAGLGLFGWLVLANSWRAMAVTASVISLIAIALYWNALILFFPHKVGAIAVSIAVLVSLLWVNWPSQVDIGY